MHLDVAVGDAIHLFDYTTPTLLVQQQIRDIVTLFAATLSAQDIILICLTHSADYDTI